MWKVYGLIDPRDGRIRYIGCTKRARLAARLNHHVGSATGTWDKSYDAKRNQWIREVLAAGMRPSITELERHETRDEGWAAEKRWISRLREELVNETGGGGGITDPSDELRERLSTAISEAQKKAWAKDDGTRRAAWGEIGKQNWKKAAAASIAARKGKPLPQEWRDNMVAAHRTPEARARMSAIKKGTIVSDETRARQSTGIKAAWDRRKAEFLALPLKEQERITREKKDHARQKKNAAQQRRRAAKKLT